MFKFLKYMQIATKFAALQEDAEEAKSFIKGVVAELDDIDEVKDKVVAVLGAVGDVEGEFTALVEEVFDVVKVVADIEVSDEDTEVYLEKAFVYGSYIYKVLKGDIDSVTALTYITAALEDIEAK